MKLSVAVAKNNFSKVDKLIDSLKVVTVDARRKSAMTSQTANLSFLGVDVEFDCACLSPYIQFQSHLCKAYGLVNGEADIVSVV